MLKAGSRPPEMKEEEEEEKEEETVGRDREALLSEQVLGFRV
jgi:hypothetical protein